MGEQPKKASRRARGRIERGLYVAVPRAYRDGHLDAELDAGAVALARTIGRAVDQAAADGEYYAVAQLSRELRELMSRMKLDPSARKVGRDELSDILASLAAQ